MLCCNKVTHQVNISLCAMSLKGEVSYSTSLQLLWSQYQSFKFLDFQIGFGFGFLGYKNSGFGSVVCGKTMIFLIWKPVIEKSHISDTVLFAILNCMRSDEKSQFKKSQSITKILNKTIPKRAASAFFFLIPYFEKQATFFKICLVSVLNKVQHSVCFLYLTNNSC